jgi:ribosome-associated protein
LTSHDLARACADAARAKKAKDIVIMDLQGISIIADYFVICTGTNVHQLQAISEHIDEKLAEQKISPLRIEGLKDARWILITYFQKAESFTSPSFPVCNNSSVNHLAMLAEGSN